MSKITAWKGGRSERIEARITHEAKIELLARIDREGFGSFADWLEYQAMPQLTQRREKARQSRGLAGAVWLEGRDRTGARRRHSE